MIVSFTDLNVWKKSDQVAHKIFDLSEKFPKIYQFDLTSQIRRSALSIPTNIAEGSASIHTKDFLQFLNISRRSLNETRYLVSFASKRGLIENNHRDKLESDLQEISKMLNGLIKSVRAKYNKSQPLNA